MTITKVIKEVIWLQNLLRNLKLVQEYVNMYCDIQCVIHLVKNKDYHTRTKHINVWFYFVRKIVDEMKILLQQNQDCRESHIYID